MWATIGYLGLAISVFAPLLSVGVLIGVLGGYAKHGTSQIPAVSVWIILSVTVIVSLLEALWTLSGHPTWSRGMVVDLADQPSSMGR